MKMKCVYDVYFLISIFDSTLLSERLGRYSKYFYDYLLHYTNLYSMIINDHNHYRKSLIEIRLVRFNMFQSYMIFTSIKRFLNFIVEPKKLFGIKNI